MQDKYYHVYLFLEISLEFSMQNIVTDFLIIEPPCEMF